jgi:predicted transcriptional regulator
VLWSPFFVAATETGKYKLFSFLIPIIPLFTRIKKDDALDSFVRGRIYGFIEANPGTHYTEIMKQIGVGNGTLSHHLHMLEKMDMIKSRREGVRYRAFYVTGMQFPQSSRYRLTELQAEIIKIVTDHEGISQKEIRKLIRKNKTTVNYNIKTLERNGVLRLEKIGRNSYCYIYE